MAQDVYNPYGQQDYSKASESLGQASNMYANSASSYDNAAARVRNRVNAQGNANANDLASRFQQRGLGNSGLQRNAIARNQQGTQQAYTAGLVDLEKQFADQNIQRAQGMAQVGAQQGQLGQARDAFGTQYRGQDLSQALGLRSQDLAQALGIRAQDLTQSSTIRGQDIQDRLGGYNVLKDVLGAQYEFGNTRLGTGDQAFVNQVLNRLLGGTI